MLSRWFYRHMNVIVYSFAILLFLGFMGLGIWWKMALWGECRDAGHSRLYCWSMTTAPTRAVVVR